MPAHREEVAASDSDPALESSALEPRRDSYIREVSRPVTDELKSPAAEFPATEPESGEHAKAGLDEPREVESAAPTSSLAPTAAARRLVEALVARGVDMFFGIPGGPVCPVFEAI